MGRDMICLGQNSNTEHMENGVRDLMGLGRVGPELIQRSGVDMVLQL